MKLVPILTGDEREKHTSAVPVAAMASGPSSADDAVAGR